MDYIGKKLKQTETWQKLTRSKCFSCFKTKLKQALKKVKKQGSISGVSKHWNNGLYREKTEMDWNRKKIDQVQTFQLFRNVSKQNWNKLWKKWKYQAPFLVFRNTETMDYIGKKLKQTETGRKLTKSKRFSCFEMFRNKIETSFWKGENTSPISGVSKHWNNGLYREKTETDWNRKKID